jgi:hypothetical protein
MWVAVHIILDRTSESNDSESQTEDADLLLKLMPEHSDLQTVGTAKTDLLSYMDMWLSNHFDPFCEIILALSSTANTYYRSSVAKQRKRQQFERAEIEDAFAAYVQTFEEHMPQEETWEYLHNFSK